MTWIRRYQKKKKKKKKKKMVIPKLESIAILRLQVRHDYVHWHCSINYCVKLCLVNETLCGDCSLKWFLLNSIGDIGFLIRLLITQSIRVGHAYTRPTYVRRICELATPLLILSSYNSLYEMASPTLALVYLSRIYKLASPTRFLSLWNSLYELAPPTRTIVLIITVEYMTWPRLHSSK